MPSSKQSKITMPPTIPAKFRVALNLNINAVYSLEDFHQGSPPLNPTLDDLLEVIERAGGPGKIIEDWGLIDSQTCMDVTLVEDDEFRATTTVDYFGNELHDARLVLNKK